MMPNSYHRDGILSPQLTAITDSYSPKTRSAFFGHDVTSRVFKLECNICFVNKEQNYKPLSFLEKSQSHQQLITFFSPKTAFMPVRLELGKDFET